MNINLLSTASSNRIILIFEIIAFVVSIAMIVVGLIQNKKSQTGLSALNGGNDELFSSSKERGMEKVLSVCMLCLGIALFVATIIICILTNTILK